MPVTFGLILLLVACATPEQTLKRGYEGLNASVKATTVLVNRDAITVKDAENALALGESGKAMLDSGKESLIKCRATPGAKCTAAVSNINLGSGVLMQLENYLKEHQ